MRMYTGKQVSGCGIVAIGDWRHIQINGPAIWYWKVHGNVFNQTWKPGQKRGLENVIE